MTERSDKKRMDLNTTQVAAGSMASVTSAVAASNLGVAGTLVGAGVGSMVGAVTGAVYEHYIDRTRDQVRAVVPRRPAHNERPADEPTVTMPTAVGAPAKDPDPTSVRPSLPAPAAEPAPAPMGDDQPMWRWLRSHRLALGVSAAAAFGIAVLALTAFEAFTGQPISSTGTSNGGTSIGSVFGGGSSSSSDTDTDPTPNPSPSATDNASPSAPETASPSTTATEPTTTQQPTSSPTVGVPQPTSPAG